MQPWKYRICQAIRLHEREHLKKLILRKTADVSNIQYCTIFYAYMFLNSVL